MPSKVSPRPNPTGTPSGTPRTTPRHSPRTIPNAPGGSTASTGPSKPSAGVPRPKKRPKSAPKTEPGSAAEADDTWREVLRKDEGYKKHSRSRRSAAVPWWLRSCIRVATCGCLMDVVNSFRPKRIYDLNDGVSANAPLFSALQLTEHQVALLFDKFTEIDKDRSGTIALWELLEHMDVIRTKFSKRVFLIFDEDGSGEIDFREFVVALWNYCTLSKASLIMFAFDLYDRDTSGVLDFDEVKQMLKEVYGRDNKSNPYKEAIEAKLDAAAGTDGTSTMTVEQFADFTRSHPALLFPAFQMQEVLRKGICGGAFWNSCSKKRIELSDGKEVTINSLMHVHVNPDSKARIARDTAGGGVADRARKFNQNPDTAFNDMQVEAAILETGTVAQRRANRDAAPGPGVHLAMAKGKPRHGRGKKGRGGGSGSRDNSPRSSEYESAPAAGRRRIVSADSTEIGRGPHGGGGRRGGAREDLNT